MKYFKNRVIFSFFALALSFPVVGNAQPATNVNYGNSTFNDPFFAPVTEIAANKGFNLDTLSSSFIIKTITATESGEVTPSFNGYAPVSQDAVYSLLSRARQKDNGEAIISFGESQVDGRRMKELAQATVDKSGYDPGRSDFRKLVESYRTPISMYNLHTAQFNIPNYESRDVSQLRNRAIYELQQNYGGLNVIYSLPVHEYGFAREQLDVIQDAVDKNIKISNINIREILFDSKPNGEQNLAQGIIKTLENIKNQLRDIDFIKDGRRQRLSDEEVWNMLGFSALVEYKYSSYNEYLSGEDLEDIRSFAEDRRMRLLSVDYVNPSSGYERDVEEFVDAFRDFGVQ